MTKARDRHVTCVRSSVDPEPGVSETVAAIVQAHRAGTQSPAETVARTFARIAAHADPAVFISLRPEADAVNDARALTDKRLPLYGVPVAAGLVPLALGTDTAGSGRVPAGLNNIVGLKPSLGLVSTAGVVPACRSLDCVSLFALTTDDAFAALAAIAGPDAADPYSRTRPLGAPGGVPADVRIGMPMPGQRLFFGDKASAAAYDAALADLAGLGAAIVEIDI